MAIIFYSWQSDLPNRTNRGFIQKALENAAKRIHKDESIEVEPVIERDTQGLPGSPDIAQAIFEKIEQSKVFVCDVSIINAKPRPTPNPNVLIELGYAMKTLGPERVLLVLNTAFGDPSLLPFDLRMRRVIKYTMPETTQEKKEERRNLEAEFERALRAIFETPFDYLEGTWDHLTSDKVRFDDGRTTEIVYLGHGKLQITTHTPNHGRWTGRIKMDQDMPEWGEGYYTYDHGRESGRQMIIVEAPTLIRVFPVPLTHEKGSTTYYFWQKHKKEA